MSSVWHSDNRHTETDPMGIIYLGWNGRGIQAAGWKAFSVRLSEEQRRWSPTIVGKQWWGKDLFLFVRKPKEEPAPFEEWLLTTALQLRDRWGRGFLDTFPEPTAAGWHLHAGVSSLQAGSGDLEDDEWYDSLKRALIQGGRSDAIEQRLKRLAFDRILQERRIRAVYQPIVSLADGRRFGFEALTRVDSERFEGPLQLFKFAEEEGESFAIDLLARERAIDGCGALRNDQKIFINMSAHIMDDPHYTPGQTLKLLERRGLSPSNVVFEITERSSIDDFSTAVKTLNHYRSQGYQIAIDDAGAGYSSLQSIVELRPDYIKVDRSLVNHIDRDEMKQHLMGTFVGLARKMGIGVIAEGIERQEELEQVNEMGVHYAQGYLLGRPVAQLE